MTELNQFFKGLKVIEISSILAGPMCGSFFAELGADVIKIEKKNGGDDTRKWKLPHEDEDAVLGSYYAAANFGKEVWSLDLKDEADLKRLYDALEGADIVISNYRPLVARRLKIDASVLFDLNPQLVLVELCGYFEDPERPAYDAVLQAESGIMSMNGMPDGPPIKMPLALIDVLASHQMREAALMGLIEKYRSAKGSHFRVSLFSSALAALINQASDYLMNKNIPGRKGSAHPNIAPYGDLLKMKDGSYIILAVGNDRQFEGLCSVVNVMDLVDDVRFKSNASRVKNRFVLMDVLQKNASAFAAEELSGLLNKKDVPHGIVKNLEEVYRSAEASGMILEEGIEGLETKRNSIVAIRRVEI